MEIENFAILDMLPFPGFCVKNGKVLKCNPAACALNISRELPIGPLLKTGHQEYAAFTDGILALTLTTPHGEYQATVTRTDGVDFFLMSQPESSPELRAYQIAAMILRGPLSNAMFCADKLSNLSGEEAEYVDQLNRSLYRILRLAANMADAAKGIPLLDMNRMNVVSVIHEILQRVDCSVDKSKVNFTYDIPDEEVVTAVDTRLIERAVLNMLSNAFKFAPKDGHVHAELTRRRNYMVFCVRDDGPGVDRAVLPTMFTRYARQADVEDIRMGMGLGMPIVRAAACTHGGTVLVNCPENGGTCVTLTIEITPESKPCVRDALGKVDYAGEMNHTLIELSDILPPDVYASAY